MNFIIGVMTKGADQSVSFSDFERWDMGVKLFRRIGLITLVPFDIQGGPMKSTQLRSSSSSVMLFIN